MNRCLASVKAAVAAVADSWHNNSNTAQSQSHLCNPFPKLPSALLSLLIHLSSCYNSGTNCCTTSFRTFWLLSGTIWEMWHIVLTLVSLPSFLSNISVICSVFFPVGWSRKENQLLFICRRSPVHGLLICVHVVNCCFPWVWGPTWCLHLVPALGSFTWLLGAAVSVFTRCLLGVYLMFTRPVCASVPLCLCAYVPLGLCASVPLYLCASVPGRAPFSQLPSPPSTMFYLLIPCW